MPRGGGFGRGGFGRGGGFGCGFGMRRYGVPLMPMGGMGLGMGGYGSPLLTGLLAGGVGYALGSNSAQQNGQQQPVYQPYPASAAPSSGADSGQLAQLKLLGELRDAGTLTNDEFERQKQRILGS